MIPKYQIDQGIYYICSEAVYVYYITEIKMSKYDPKEPFIEYHFHNGYRYTEDVLSKKIKEKEYFVSEVDAQESLIKELKKEILDFQKTHGKLIATAEERIRIIRGESQSFLTARTSRVDMSNSGTFNDKNLFI